MIIICNCHLWQCSTRLHTRYLTCYNLLLTSTVQGGKIIIIPTLQMRKLSKWLCLCLPLPPHPRLPCSVLLEHGRLEPCAGSFSSRLEAGMAIEAELAVPLASPCRVLLWELLHLTFLPGYVVAPSSLALSSVGGVPFYFQHQHSLPALVVSLCSVRKLVVFSD